MIERMRAAIRLLYPDEMTPAAKRLLESILDEEAERARGEFVPEWDVYRVDGEPVTITENQMHAIWHALNVVEKVRKAEGHRSLWDQPQVDIYKSRLLGRMLLEGKPPTKTNPPAEMGGPAWALLPGGDPFGRAGEVDQ